MSRRNLLAPRRDDLFYPIEQVFDEFFSDFFRTDLLGRIKNSGGYPKMDVLEADGKFIVSVAVSGMSRDDLDVEVSPENVLTVRGRISEEYRSPENANFYLRELRRSAFERSISLPDKVQGDPKAVMKDGLLTLTWEVAKPPTPEVRRIAIEGE